MYQEFLKSDYWREVRRIVLKRDAFQCRKCSLRLRPEVHHLTYVHHGNEKEHLYDLITLCKNCHKKLHMAEILEKIGSSEPDLIDIAWDSGFEGDVSAFWEYIESKD